MRELESDQVVEPGRVRRVGGGRKRTIEKDPRIFADLGALLEPSILGDPQSPLRWTSKSVRKLADELRVMGHDVSHRIVAELLHDAGYSLQGNRKAKEGRVQATRCRAA